MNKNKPEFKPRLQDEQGTGVPRNPLDTGTVEDTEKEKEEKKLADNALEELKDKVDLQNPAFDPDIPEQKQRNFR